LRYVRYTGRSVNEEKGNGRRRNEPNFKKGSTEINTEKRQAWVTNWIGSR